MLVKIYTDGAARGNPDGPGGYGTVLEYVDTKGQLHKKELSQGYEKTTNGANGCNCRSGGFKPFL